MLQLMNWCLTEQDEGSAFELDRDLRMPLGKSLPCANVKRNTRPSPVVNIELKLNERFRARFLLNSRFASIGNDFFVTDGSSAVLAANAAVEHVF